MISGYRENIAFRSSAIKVPLIRAVVCKGVPEHNQVFKDEFIFFGGASGSNGIQCVIIRCVPHLL